MNELEIKTLVSQVINEMSTHTSEINKCKEECEAKISKANEKLKTAVNEKNEIEATSQEIKDALEKLKGEYEELNKRYEELWEEKKALEKALGEAQAKELLNEMNEAIAGFTDKEKAYAQAEINAFKDNPSASEINPIVNKIWEGIGKTAKANDKAIAEKNAIGTNVEDIFGEVGSAVTPPEDVNIF